MNLHTLFKGIGLGLQPLSLALRGTTHDMASGACGAGARGLKGLKQGSLNATGSREHIFVPSTIDGWAVGKESQWKLVFEKRTVKNALSEREPTAYQLFGLLSACTQHGIKRLLRVTSDRGARGGGGGRVYTNQKCTHVCTEQWGY